MDDDHAASIHDLSPEIAAAVEFQLKTRHSIDSKKIVDLRQMWMVKFTHHLELCFQRVLGIINVVLHWCHAHLHSYVYQTLFCKHSPHVT